MNTFEVEEAALISMSRLQRTIMDNTQTRRILMLIDAGLPLEEAERIVLGNEEQEESSHG